jgi:hypothetical protein
MKPQLGWKGNPRSQLLLAAVVAVACTVRLLMGDLDGSTRRFDIPWAVMVPLGYVMAAVVAVHAVLLWRRQRRR